MPGLVDGAGGRDLLHDLSPAAVRADRQAAADDLAEAGDVRLDAVQLLRAAASDTEARDHFIEDQQRSVLARERAQSFQKAFGRRNDAHVSRDRLHDDGCDAIGVLLEQPPDGRQIVVGRDERQLGECGGHARTVGEAERRDARAGSSEQAIGVAVIAAIELDDAVAASERAREPQRGHRRLGA